MHNWKAIFKRIKQAVRKKWRENKFPGQVAESGINTKTPLFAISLFLITKKKWKIILSERVTSFFLSDNTQYPKKNLSPDCLEASPKQTSSQLSCAHQYLFMNLFVQVDLSPCNVHYTSSSVGTWLRVQAHITYAKTNGLRFWKMSSFHKLLIK